jgi:hypothetical protein
MRRRLTAIVLAVLVFSLIAASAATLSVNSAELGAGSDTFVAACDDAVDVDYNTSFSGTEYVVDDVVISGVNDVTCLGEALSFQVLDSGGNAIAGADGSATVVAAQTSYTIALGTPASAAAVYGVAVVIAGS